MFRRAAPIIFEAADRGHAGATYYLGLMAMYGHGVPVDYRMALTWFSKAAQCDDTPPPSVLRSVVTGGGL